MDFTMKQLTALSLVTTCLLLAGCNTWQGAKEDARVVGDKTVEGTKKAGQAVGTGLEKAGDGISGAGETVKDKSQ